MYIELHVVIDLYLCSTCRSNIEVTSQYVQPSIAKQFTSQTEFKILMYCQKVLLLI